MLFVWYRSYGTFRLWRWLPVCKIPCMYLLKSILRIWRMTPNQFVALCEWYTDLVSYITMHHILQNRCWELYSVLGYQLNSENVVKGKMYQVVTQVRYIDHEKYSPIFYVTRLVNHSSYVYVWGWGWIIHNLASYTKLQRMSSSQGLLLSPTFESAAARPDDTARSVDVSLGSNCLRCWCVMQYKTNRRREGGIYISHGICCVD